MRNVSEPSNPSRRAPSKVGFVIVQYGNPGPLVRCLRSLQSTCARDRVRTVVVVNGIAGGSVDELQALHPDVEFLDPGRNLGYAGAANLGLRLIESEYIVLLNNDVTFADGWLDPLVSTAEKDRQIAVIQPKVLSARDRSRFDYAGAAGGFIDRYGFPFARGRVFDTIEVDRGQYDEPIEIFWASGAAFFMRRDAVLAAGAFDEEFFVYHEETDLCWRLHLMGRRVTVCPESVIFHEGSTTFSSSPSLSRLQRYYMHRNGLLLVLKNTQARDLPFRLGVRLLLEVSSWPYLLLARPSEAAESVKGLVWLAAHRARLREMRGRAQRIRVVPDESYRWLMCGGILPVHYFLYGRRLFAHIRAW